MTPVPKRCVVDTNVPMTANRMNADASQACIERSVQALRDIANGGHLFLDAGRKILGEYEKNLLVRGEPGPGTRFLKWILTHEYNGKRVTRVPITPKDADPEDFEELPPPTTGVRYDRSDRKFLAVAAAHPDRPPVLQSGDSKWWGWTESLAKCGVRIHFLCPEEVSAKHKKKMGT